MDDHFKLGGPLCPGVDQLHSPVKVLHILAVHLEEGCQLLEDVSDAWVAVPGVEAGADMVVLILVPQVPPPHRSPALCFYFSPSLLFWKFCLYL